MRGGKHAARRRPRFAVGSVLMALVVTGLFGGLHAFADPPVEPGPPSADGVQPEIVGTKASSDRCTQLGFEHGLAFTGSGSASSDTMTVTISGFNSPSGSVAWSSTLPIHGVYVKGGPGGNLFSYPSGDTGDQDLHTPQKGNGGFFGVSNVAVCWNDVPAQPDVTVTKANDPEGAVLPGDTITYSMTVANIGDANASLVELTDQLPAGVTFEDATPGCNPAGVTVTCVGGDIGPGASLGLEITVLVDDTACGTIENIAHVSAANEVAPATENNDSNTVANTVTCSARAAQLGPDLQVTKSSDATGPLYEDDEVEYRITVTNIGGETARGVRLVDVLPVGATSVKGIPVFAGEPCLVTSSLPVGGVPHAEVRCGPAPLGPGASASVTIPTLVTDDACGEITNRVDVEGTNEPAEHVGPDNHAEATDEIECPPRIRVEKTGSHRAHLGDTVTYVLRVSNIGGLDLTDVQLTDPTCDGAATLVDDGNGNAVLAVDEKWRYRCDHTIVTADGDPVHNVAKVTADHEGGSVSDTDAHDVDVLHPGIAIEQTASPASGAPGSDVVYTYVVTNTGDATLFDISVDDDSAGHVADIGSLAPGASATRTWGVVLGVSPITNVGSAIGSDSLGMSVSDDDTTTVAVVPEGEESAGDAGGSPFTGFGAGLLGTWVLVLSALGVALLVLTGRRSPIRR